MKLVMSKYFFILLFFLAAFFATYKLTESPPVWYDEGIIVQPAINLVRLGVAKVQLAPDELISPSFVTVGYPLVYPLSLVFSHFGISVLSARALMAVFILLLVLASYFFIRSVFGPTSGVYATLLLVGFAPLYGNGKTVLGEVPGLFMLLLFLFFIHKIEIGNNHRVYFLLAGLAGGLCVATKPIFIVLMPALAIAVIVKRKHLPLNTKSLLLFLFALLLPILLWVKIQFLAGDTVRQVLQYYANPYGYGGQSIIHLVSSNVQRFFKEITPFYLLSLVLTWLISIFIRVRKVSDRFNLTAVSLVETISFIFTILILLAYVRTAGWYRYLFPAQILALLFFPSSLASGWNYIKNKINIKAKYAARAPFVVLILLAIFHFYQVGFNSWVASYYDSHKTQVLISYFAQFKKDKTVFIYDAPEIVAFLPDNNYYQYLQTVDTMRFGEDQLVKINQGIPDIIIINPRRQISSSVDFSYYQQKENLNSYLLFERK